MKFPFTIEKLQKKIRFILYPFSLLYASLMYVRRNIYWEYIKTPYKASLPLLSVGNITWGGTGKTPIVEYLLTILKEQNKTATLISRGYKSTINELPYLVDVHNCTPKIVGDEPYMIAMNNTNVHVIIDKKRRRAIEFAEKNLNQSFFILDDGMQHLHVSRDINIVLIPLEDIYTNWNYSIPAGNFREPQSALSAATIFCIKCTESEWNANILAIKKRLSSYQKPIFSFTLAVKELHQVFTHKVFTFTTKVPYSIVSGIGNPHSFYKTITEYMGYPPEMHYICTDHASKAELMQAIESCKTELCICTEKDAIKLDAIDTITVLYTKTECTFGSSTSSVSCKEYLLSILSLYI